LKRHPAVLIDPLYLLRDGLISTESPSNDTIAELLRFLLGENTFFYKPVKDFETRLTA
jgi:hypothetical protein